MARSGGEIKNEGREQRHGSEWLMAASPGHAGSIFDRSPSASGADQGACMDGHGRGTTTMNCKLLRVLRLYTRPHPITVDRIPPRRPSPQLPTPLSNRSDRVCGGSNWRVIPIGARSDFEILPELKSRNSDLSSPVWQTRRGANSPGTARSPPCRTQRR